MPNLKYYKAANDMRQPNPTSSYREDYNAIMDLGFDNAPNVVYDEVEREQTYGTNDFYIIHRVRVDTILDYNTGIILGDDYKTFIFPPEENFTPCYGMKFKWKGSYWLVINTNSYGSIPNSAEVRRCNNVLRFFDNNGERIYEPCIIDYTLRFANNEDTLTIAVGNGEQKVWCQRNKNTKLIKANDRFLFGSPEQRVAFRLYAGGTKNYLNVETMNDDSMTLTEFYLDHYEVNPLFDDLENGFADAYLNEVTIKIDSAKSVMCVGETDVVEASIYKNNIQLKDKEVVWSTSDDDVIQIKNNEVKALTVGVAILTASIKDTQIQASITVQVINEPLKDEYEIVIEPNINYVLQDKKQQFYVYLYKNGIKSDAQMSFLDITREVPHDKYLINVDGENSFTLYNKGMYMDAPVKIKIKSSIHEKIINIILRGLY